MEYIKADKQKINTPQVKGKVDISTMVDSEGRSVDPYKKDKTILEQLIDHEGYHLDPYKDTRQFLTGGLGHKFTQEDFDNFDYNWSDDEKHSYWVDRFEEDYLTASRGANKMMEEYGVESNDKIHTVLVDMIFNMGEAKVRKFDNFLTALGDKDPDKAVFEMKTGEDGKSKSKWYKQTGRRVDNLAKIVKDNL